MNFQRASPRTDPTAGNALIHNPSLPELAEYKNVPYFFRLNTPSIFSLWLTIAPRTSPFSISAIYTGHRDVVD